MPNGKIDRRTFHRMVRAGKNQAQIAKHFGVSPSAVSQYAANHRAAVTKTAVLNHADRLCRADIDLLEKTSAQEKRLLEVAQLSWDIATGDVKAVAKAQRIRKLLPRTQFSDPSAIYLQAIRELTNLLKLKKDLMMSMFDITTAAAFQKEVMKLIADMSPEMRKEVIKRLKENKALSASIRIPRRSGVAQ